MAKVLLVDYPNHRTSRHWRDYLAKHHDLKTDMYFQPIKAAWADVIWLEWCEGTAIQATQRKGHFNDVYDHDGMLGLQGAAYSDDWEWPNARIFIRPIDIDIHAGHFRSVDWTQVEGMTYIAPHFKEMLMDGMVYPPNLKIEEIRLSVKLDEWTYKERSHGYNIAWMNENWSAKNLPGAIQALHELNELSGHRKYILHVVENGRSGENWLHRHVQHMIKTYGLEDQVKFYSSAPSVDEFLEDKNYLWHTGMKEGFSLICGEALAKGIKVLMMNWESSTAIWPAEFVCNNATEMAVATLNQPYESKFYREVAERYSHDKEIAALRAFTGL